MGFIEIQNTFTQHIRDPEHCPAPVDVEDRRMEIYRGLLYRNVENFMSNSFPVLRKIISDEKWHSIIRDYFKNHIARTPLFPKMPSEFLQYLQHERAPHPDDYPFLQELAHYEWVELELSLDNRTISLDGINPAGDLLSGIPVLNDLILPLAYQFPVHKIGPDHLPEQAPEQPTYIIVYRDRKHEIGFLELNPVSARLVELLQVETGDTGRDLLQQIAEEMNHPNPETVIKGGSDIMNKMLVKDVLLGTRQG